MNDENKTDLKSQDCSSRLLEKGALVVQFVKVNSLVIVVALLLSKFIFMHAFMRAELVIKIKKSRRHTRRMPYVLPAF